MSQPDAHLAALQTLRACGRSCTLDGAKAAIRALPAGDFAAVRNAHPHLRTIPKLAQIAVRYAENTGRHIHRPTDASVLP